MSACEGAARQLREGMSARADSFEAQEWGYWTVDTLKLVIGGPVLPAVCDGCRRHDMMCELPLRSHVSPILPCLIAPPSSFLAPQRKSEYHPHQRPSRTGAAGGGGGGGGGNSQFGQRASEVSILSALPRSRFYKAVRTGEGSWVQARGEGWGVGKSRGGELGEGAL
jgi:hypothetical protein